MVKYNDLIHIVYISTGNAPSGIIPNSATLGVPIILVKHSKFRVVNIFFPNNNEASDIAKACGEENH